MKSKFLKFFFVPLSLNQLSLLQHLDWSSFICVFQGLCNSFPFIIIAALSAGTANEHNRNETLSMTAVQASWLGSIAYITGNGSNSFRKKWTNKMLSFSVYLIISEPIGSVMSAFITGLCVESKWPWINL